MENTQDIKNTIANNIIKYRKNLGLTQLELAEKLNYSDKTLSKWERAEAIPDIITLSQLAEIFNVTVDEIISNEPILKTNAVKVRKGLSRKKIITITLLSLCIVWLVATCSFVFLSILPINFNSMIFKPWMSFIYAIPISSILLLVFSGIWGNSIDCFISTSLLIWTLILAITVTLSYIDNIFLLYILAIPCEIMAFIFFIIYKKIKNGTLKK